MNLLRQKFSQLSFRKQLITWFVFFLMGGWLIFLIILTFIFSNTLRQQIDHHLHIVVIQAKRIWQESDRQTRARDIQSLVSSQGMIVMVLAEDGSSLTQTTSPDVTLLTQHQLQNLMAQSDIYNDLNKPYHFSDFNIRFATLPVRTAEGEGLIAVGYSLELIYNTLRDLALIFLLISLLILGLLIISANWIVNKALLPIQNIINITNNIQNSQDLSVQIPSRKINDELGQLTRAINTMMSRLHNVFIKQKSFFNDAAHTLKTPLTTLMLQNELIMQMSKNKQVKDKANQSIAIINQTTHTIEKLLFLGRENKSKYQKINFSLLIEELISLVQPIADKKQLNIQSKINRNAVMYGDYESLQKAVLSILENALLYTPFAGQIKINLRKTQHKLFLSIKDNGPGINKAEKSLVWQRFYRGKSGMESGSGSGLGLAIAKKVFENHHGEIRLKSSNTGLTVLISLPHKYSS